ATADARYADKVVDYSVLAGERALTQLAPHEALRWFSDVLEHDLDDARRCDALTGLGVAQRRLGDGAFRKTLLEATAISERVGDQARLTRAVVANTLGPFGAAAERDDDRIEALERALETVARDEPERPLMLAILGKECYYGGDPARGAQ